MFKTENRSDHLTYRPVSLTSIPCRMLEHIFKINIMGHLEQYKIFNDEQHGFRRGRSRESQLALPVNDLAKASDRQSQADMVIVDLSKAIDPLTHQRIHSKLCNLGITGKLGPKFYNNKNTKGSIRWCFFLVYDANLRCNTRDGFRLHTFYSLPKRPSIRNIIPFSTHG